MPKKIQCKKHKYIGKKIELVKNKTGLPLECSLCRKMYFSDNPLDVKTLASRNINFCSSCKEAIKCSGCKCKFDINSFFIAECIKCGNIEFFCPKCSKRILILPLEGSPDKKVLLKLQKIFKEFMPGINGDLLKDLGKLNKQKGFSNIPPLLLFHFDIILPDIFGNSQDFHGHDIDDADWWKKPPLLP